MTKRVKTFKPKQGLSKAQVQSLVALMKSELEALEWSIGHYKHVAESCKSNKKDINEISERYFKLVDKARNKRNKLSLIQAKLKRGLV